MVNYDSNNLFIQFQQGDEHAFELLFKKLFPRLNDFARNILNDDQLSQDIVQDVFIKVWEKKASIEPINIEAFIFRVLKNQCINHFKFEQLVENKKVNLKELKDMEELYRIDFMKDEPYQLIEKELQNELDFILNTLPKRCKEVFILSRVEGLKNKEIAEKLQIHIKNVEKHITKALSIYRTHFKINQFSIFISLLIKYLSN